MEIFEEMLESDECLEKFKVTKKMPAIQIPAVTQIIRNYRDQSERVVPVDPQLMFQRALSLTNSSAIKNITFDECLATELYRVALSLFDENGFMRTPANADQQSSRRRDVGWSTNTSFESIITSYKES